MSMYRILFFFCCLYIGTYLSASSQDIHYSQFMNAPTFLNPAQTGNYQGSWRFSNSYRQQWTAISPPFVSNALSYDQQILESSDKLSGGALFIYDRSGDLKFTSAKMLISAAYHKKLSNDMTLSAGIQPVLSLKSFSTQNLTFPDQFNNSTGSFDPNMATADALSNRQTSNMNINTGIYFRKTTDRISPEGGIALFNLIPNRESFYGYDIKAQRRWNLNAACLFNFKTSYFVKPQIQYLYQEKASSFVFGTHVGHYLPPNEAGIKHVYLGAYMRSGFARATDAIVPMVGMRIKKFDLGLSYDFNISSLKTATNYRGAIEFSIIYTNWKDILKVITPNCERM